MAQAVSREKKEKKEIIVFLFAARQTRTFRKNRTHVLQLPSARRLIDESLTRSVDHVRKMLDDINTLVSIVFAENVHRVVGEIAAMLAPAFHFRIESGQTIQANAWFYEAWAAPQMLRHRHPSDAIN